MTTTIYKGDYGTVFEMTITDPDGVALDISAAIEKDFIFKPPGSTTKTVATSFKTDGTDGVLTATIAANFIDKQGVWSLQADIKMAAGEWRSTILKFTVAATL